MTTMHPPRDLVWTHVLGALLGRADGQVFVSDQLLETLDQFWLEIERDPAAGGWFVRLIPAQPDGSIAPRSMGE